MARTVQCVKLNKEAEGLDFPPLPGELGKKIWQSVSKEAWAGWLKHQTMLINENRLNMADARARQYLLKQSREVLLRRRRRCGRRLRAAGELVRRSGKTKRVLYRRPLIGGRLGRRARFQSIIGALHTLLRAQQQHVRATQRERPHRHHARDLVDLLFDVLRLGDRAAPTTSRITLPLLGLVDARLPWSCAGAAGHRARPAARHGCTCRIGITSTGSGNAPSVSTSLLPSAMQTKRPAAAATIFSRVSAPPPPLIIAPEASISSAPSDVDRESRPLRSGPAPGCHAAAGVAWKPPGWTPRAESARLNAAMASMKKLAVEPVPTPSTAPWGTSCFT